MDLVRHLHCKCAGSHLHPSRWELAHERRRCKIFTFGEYPAIVFDPYSRIFYLPRDEWIGSGTCTASALVRICTRADGSLLTRGDGAKSSPLVNTQLFNAKASPCFLFPNLFDFSVTQGKSFFCILKCTEFFYIPCIFRHIRCSFGYKITFIPYPLGDIRILSYNNLTPS